MYLLMDFPFSLTATLNGEQFFSNIFQIVNTSRTSHLKFLLEQVGHI